MDLETNVLAWERPPLRLVEAPAEALLDEAPDHEEPLTPEMEESLGRLRERLRGLLFQPGFSSRPQWSSLPPGN